MEREFQIAVLARDGMMHRDELRAVGKRAFNLHVINHLRHAGHDLVAAQQLAAEIHQLGNALAVADEFKEHGGDERHGFGMVQLHAAGQSLLRERARLMQREFVEFSWGEMHG